MIRDTKSIRAAVQKPLILEAPQCTHTVEESLIFVKVNFEGRSELQNRL